MNVNIALWLYDVFFMMVYFIMEKLCEWKWCLAFCGRWRMSEREKGTEGGRAKRREMEREIRIIPINSH